MSQLTQLRSQLAALRRARTSVRWGAALAALGIAVLWTLAGIFVLDLIFELSVAQRIVVFVLGAGGLMWAINRYTLPFLGVRESELEMALLVEKNQRIDSDLVAAIQFEEPEAQRWGSAQLETAVIHQVANVSNRLNVFDGFDRSQLSRRLWTLLLTAVVVGASAIAFPQYASIFFNRLLLGAKHYPSDTVIEAVLVNHTHVLSRLRNGTSPDSTKAAQSRPVQFLVQCAGTLPSIGEVKLQNSASGQQRKLTLLKLSLDERLARLRQAETALREATLDNDRSLTGAWRDDLLIALKFDAPVSADLLLKSETDRSALAASLTALGETIAAWPKDADRTALYHCELGRMIDSVTYKLKLGDAWTDPAQIGMIPLPTVESLLTVTPPDYAKQAEKAPDPSLRQISVLEGSAVEVGLTCTNGKRLATAWLTVRQGEKIRRFDLAPADATRLTWRLAEGGVQPRTLDENGDPLPNPFASIKSELRYEIQVTDEDNLQLETPIQGMIRIKADRPPTGSADVVHRVVLPTAKPVIEYRVHDDFGVGQVSLLMQVERLADAAKESALSTETSNEPTPSKPDDPVAAKTDERQAVTVRTGEVPLLVDALPFVGKHEVALDKLKLVKGDRLKLTLEVHDYRGQTPGEVFFSDPLYLEISDEDGVFSAILDADKKADERLSEIIKRQLGIGESP